MAFVGPRGAGARAQLLAALLLMAVAPLCIGERPFPTHSVKLDLWPSPENPASSVPPPVGAFALSSIDLPDELLRLPPLRRIDLAADGRILADGAAVTLTGLRMRLDIAALEDGHWVEFRPDPNARYELFVEVFAVTRWARLQRLHLDNARFARILDESYDGGRRERRPGDRPPEG
jgi:hypothetical protein